MNYLEYVVYHNCDKGRIVVRHTQRFFTSYEEAKENAVENRAGKETTDVCFGA